MDDVLRDFSTSVSAPVFWGLPYGHGEGRRVLPIGLRATVEGSRGAPSNRDRRLTVCLLWRSVMLTILQLSYMRPLMAACLVGSMASCATIGRFNILSTEQEVEIGREAAREIERDLKLYNDPVVTAYVNGLGQTLAGYSSRSGLTYYFKVVDTDEVNAFALPGGWLYVNRGLITTAESESELAGVIGHEIGHVDKKHGARGHQQTAWRGGVAGRDYGRNGRIRKAPGRKTDRRSLLRRETAELWSGRRAGGGPIRRGINIRGRNRSGGYGHVFPEAGRDAEERTRTVGEDVFHPSSKPGTGRECAGTDRWAPSQSRLDEGLKTVSGN